MIHLSMSSPRKVTLCNTNYSLEGIYHPDRILDEYDFLYLLEGTWEIIEEETSYYVDSGKLIILEPGLRHYSVNKCSPCMKNMYLHCNIAKDDGILKDTAISLPKIIDCSKKPQVQSLFQEIIKTYWSSKNSLNDFKLNALLQLLFIELATKSIPPAQTDPIIQEILTLFSTNIHIFYRPTTLAALYGLSQRSLSMRFKKETNTSIHQYQLTLKLNLAHQLLTEYPNRGLRDIALSLGFYDEFQFSKLYKRQFKLPPSYMRK